MQKMLTEIEAAPLIGVAVGTLQNWRVRGEGPKFIRVGRLVRYDPADLEAWKAARRVGSTSELVAA
jgi:predicted DNA-binding transcriptional regulator AlpA